MNLYFFTGSKNKFAEVQKIISNLKHIDLDLPEIQEIDPKKIIAAKLTVACSYKKIPCIVEDTSLYFSAFNGLPGPLIKWFIKTIGLDGLYKMVSAFKNQNAIAKTVIGYATNAENVHYFEGEVSGEIVKPRGTNGFGWDALFIPNGSKKTFGEMNIGEKAKYSMRGIATKKLLQYIQTK